MWKLRPSFPHLRKLQWKSVALYLLKVAFSPIGYPLVQMNSVGLITLCCGSMWFQKSKDSKHSGSGKDNWILERLSPAQSVLFNQELLCSLPIFLQTSSWLREKGVLLSNSSLCNFSPVHDVGILMLLIEEKMKTNISVLQLSFLVVLTRTDTLWRSRAGVCRGTGGDYWGFPGCSSIRVLFVPSRVSSAAAASRAGLRFAQLTARVVFNLCLSLCQA